MRTLTASLDEAFAGHGQLVMLAGEPGIGKTRTAQEIAACAVARGAWRTGRALILVKLKYDSGMKAHAILEVGCRLPGNGGIPGTIEGIRILIDGGLNFNEAADPRATLFIDITDQDDDDDD